MPKSSSKPPPARQPRKAEVPPAGACAIGWQRIQRRGGFPRGRHYPRHPQRGLFPAFRNGTDQRRVQGGWSIPIASRCRDTWSCSITSRLRRKDLRIRTWAPSAPGNGSRNATLARLWSKATASRIAGRTSRGRRWRPPCDYGQALDRGAAHGPRPRAGESVSTGDRVRSAVRRATERRGLPRPHRAARPLQGRSCGRTAGGLTCARRSEQ